MPRFDGTGPDGEGPLTGRGMGPCSDDAWFAPRRGFGRGFRGGFGRGFGRGRRFRSRRFGYVYWDEPESSDFSSLSNENKKSLLEDELKILKEEISMIQDKLKNLK